MNCLFVCFFAKSDGWQIFFEIFDFGDFPMSSPFFMFRPPCFSTSRAGANQVT